MTTKQHVPSSPVESPKLMALAFSDAVRDILQADGVFHLGDERQDDTVWEWDGVRWTRLPLSKNPSFDDQASSQHEPDSAAAP